MENKMWYRKSSMHKVLIAGLVIISLSSTLLVQSCKTPATPTQTVTTTQTVTITPPVTTPPPVTTTTTVTITPPATTPPPATTTPAPSGIRVEIIEHSMSVTESGVPVVIGTIQNVVSYFLSGAEIWVKFYDAAGELLGTSNDLTNNDLGPGDVWSFVIIYFGPNPENVVSYTVEVGFPNY